MSYKTCAVLKEKSTGVGRINGVSNINENITCLAKSKLDQGA